MSEGTGTALVVGASRGLGLGLVRELAARGWSVMGTERPARPSADLRATAAASSGRIEIGTVDIVSEEAIAALARAVEGRRFDLLFVNAGVLDDPARPISDVSDADWARVMNTNARGPLRVIAAVEGSLAADATVAVMSSGLGSVAGNTSGGYEAYRASKAALNMLMRSYAARAGRRRTVLCVSPGWVRTDMGGSAATLDVATSAKGIIDTLAKRRGRGGAAFVDYRDVDIAW